MEQEKKEILDLLRSSEMKKWVRSTTQLPLAKNARVSKVLRQQGNQLLNKQCHDAQVHEEIWKKYSSSIAAAESNSDELAFAYGNRSVILLHMNKYTACISDIDRALSITKNESFSIKLLLRKVKCLHALGLEECTSEFEKAKHLWSEIADVSLKKSFQNDIDKVRFLLKVPIKEKVVFKDRKSIVLNDLTHQYRVNDFSSVKVHYSTKYGRHLIAARDFRPGDVIYIEKPFIRSPNVANSHGFCSHCFATTWANIPCDNCALAMFCSEECKNEAWTKYHDIECSILADATNKGYDMSMQLAVRLLIIALREFGSVEKLKSELMTFDECTDRKKGFIVDDKIETDGFKTIYNLSSNVSNENCNKHKSYTKMVLKSLAENTSYLGDCFNANDAKSYKNNENALFLGSLFLRLSKISQLNSRPMWNDTYDCKRKLKLKLGLDCGKDQCCWPGVYIAPISSLLNHSCKPNVNRCYTNDHTIVLYAVEPIKKTSQIFDCYTQPYYISLFVNRQKVLSNIYNFQCDCIACKAWWPTKGDYVDPMLAKTAHIDGHPGEEKVKSVLNEAKLLKEYEDLSRKWVFNIETNYDDRTVARLRDNIEIGLAQSSTPCGAKTNLIEFLQVVFHKMYGINLEVPKECYNV